MDKKNIVAPIVRNFVLFTIATAFILINSKGESPLFPHIYSWDSSIFMYIGKSIKYGYVPYRDVFDIKGPLWWTIQWLGQVICEGRIGIFIIEVINFNIITFVIYYISRKYTNLIISCIIVFVAYMFYKWGGMSNQVEDFSSMLSLAAVFLVLMKKTSNKMCYMQGILAICAMLIRFTDCVICGGCIIYLIILPLIEKDLKTALNRLIFIALGVLTILVPVFPQF